MRSYHYIFIFCVYILTGCKTEFETIRTSNSPERILKAANKYYQDESYDKAITLYELVIQHYRGRAEAEDLFFKYAYSHYHLGDYMLAASYFKNYSKTFSNSPNKQEADYMSAYSNFRLSPNAKLDQTYTATAIQEFEDFINAYPQTERAEQGNKMIDLMRAKQEQKAFDQGFLYYKIGEFQAAVTSLQIMLKDFPDSKKVEEVRYLIVKSSFTLAYDSVNEKKKERFNETLANHQMFVKKHPKSKWLKEVNNIKKSTLEELKKLNS
jgi:outer membrane protein assembly factor BamD